MELFINKNQLKNILESYYREKNGKDVEVQITDHITYSEYFTCTSKEVEVSYKVVMKEILLNQEIKVTHTLTKQSILEILREMIQNYDIESITEETGIDYVGLYEDQISLFSGITLKVKNKEMKMELKKDN